MSPKEICFLARFKLGPRQNDVPGEANGAHCCEYAASQAERSRKSLGALVSARSWQWCVIAAPKRPLGGAEPILVQPGLPVGP